MEVKLKRDSNVTEVWESTTLRGSWILDEESKATADQIENDRLFAENLQGSSEYTQLSEHEENDEEKLNYNPAEQDYEENDEDNYNPVDQNEETNEDNDEDNYNPEEQKEETNGKNKISFGHQEIELTHIVASRALPKISRTCDICMDRPKDATLVCGHRYCYQCALQMRLDERVCAICKRCIVSVIKTLIQLNANEHVFEESCRAYTLHLSAWLRLRTLILWMRYKISIFSKSCFACVNAEL